MPAKDPAAVALGRRGGQAKVRKGPMAKMSPAERAAYSAKMLAAKMAKKNQAPE